MGYRTIIEQKPQKTKVYFPGFFGKAANKSLKSGIPVAKRRTLSPKPPCSFPFIDHMADAKDQYRSERYGLPVKHR